jgi:hypothetical protein
MSEVSLSNIFNPGQRFIEGAYQAAYDRDIFVLATGIVVDLARDVNFDKESSKVIPQYSIKAKVVGEGVVVEQNNNFSTEVDDWYVPFLPIHNLSLPEIGEEILIIRETTESNSKGYWIGRVNNSPWVSTHLAGDNSSQGALGETGLSINTTALNNINDDVQPSRAVRVTGVPALLGDVIQQGRSRTYIRHSFSPTRNKRGVLEMGIMNNRFYSSQDNIATIGRTATKTVHIEKGRLSDIGSRTKLTTLPKIIQTPGGPRSIKEVNVVRNFIANMADETYSISLEADAEAQLHRHVLGEKLQNYQEDFGGIMSTTLDKLTDFVTTMQDFMNYFLTHTHGIPEINLEIPEKEVEVLDSVRDADRIRYQSPQRVQVGDQIISIPRPPVITPGKLRTKITKKKINYEDITIGGEDNARITTSPETDQVTRFIDTSLDERKNEFTEQINELATLISSAKDILSKRHYLN